MGGLQCRSLLRCHLCMRMYLHNASSSRCQAPMDIFSDYALLRRRDPSTTRFQLHHRLIQQTLGLHLHQAGITHVVEPQYLSLSQEEGPEFGRGSGLT